MGFRSGLGLGGACTCTLTPHCCAMGPSLSRFTGEGFRVGWAQRLGFFGIARGKAVPHLAEIGVGDPAIQPGMGNGGGDGGQPDRERLLLGLGLDFRRSVHDWEGCAECPCQNNT